MTTETQGIVESTPIFTAKPLVDLSKYDQSSFDRGRANWFILLWWLVQAIAFPLSLHNFSFFAVGYCVYLGQKLAKK